MKPDCGIWHGDRFVDCLDFLLLWLSFELNPTTFMFCNLKEHTQQTCHGYNCTIALVLSLNNAILLGEQLVTKLRSKQHAPDDLSVPRFLPFHSLHSPSAFYSGTILNKAVISFYIHVYKRKWMQSYVFPARIMQNAGNENKRHTSRNEHTSQLAPCE